MSSLILHLAISKYLKEKNNFSDEFLIGAIAPDIYKKYKESRDATHYIRVYENNGKIKRLPDINKFLEENKEKMDTFLMGYLVHLIQDRIWFNEYIPIFAEHINKDELIYTKDNSKHSDEEFSKEIYLDYAVADRFVLSKVNLDLQELKENAKKYFNDEKVSKIIDNEIKTYEPQMNRENCFLTDEIIEKYYKQCIEECNKVIELIKI